MIFSASSFTGNQIGVGGAVAISESLKVNQSITGLYLYSMNATHNLITTHFKLYLSHYNETGF